MKTRLRPFVPALVLLVAPVASPAAPPSLRDGQAVLDQCRSAITVVEQDRAGAGTHDPTLDLPAGLCAGLIAGIMAAVRVAGAESRPLPPLLCPPPMLTVEQAIRSVIKTLESHPDLLPENGATVAVQALRLAYPCPTPP
jgi:hypothetical protein